MANIQKITVVTAHDSLGDIDPGQYHEMLGAVISEKIGGEFECVLILGISGEIRVEMDDDNDPADAEDTILRLTEVAFNRCCAGDPLPLV